MRREAKCEAKKRSQERSDLRGREDNEVDFEVECEAEGGERRGGVKRWIGVKEKFSQSGEKRRREVSEKKRSEAKRSERENLLAGTRGKRSTPVAPSLVGTR